jgi:hypothetical protein
VNVVVVGGGGPRSPPELLMRGRGHGGADERRRGRGRETDAGCRVQIVCVRDDESKHALEPRAQVPVRGHVWVGVIARVFEHKQRPPERVDGTP